MPVELGSVHNQAMYLNGYILLRVDSSYTDSGFLLSRQQGGTSSHSASQREGSNRFTSSWQQQGVRGNYNTGEGRHGHENESGSSTGRGRRSIDPIEALGRCM